MTDVQCEPENFKGRIIFMSMYNDIDWKEKRKTKNNVKYNSQKVCKSRSLAILGTWIRKAVVRELTLTNLMVFGIQLLKT